MKTSAPVVLLVAVFCAAASVPSPGDDVATKAPIVDRPTGRLPALNGGEFVFEVTSRCPHPSLTYPGDERAGLTYVADTNQIRYAVAFSADGSTVNIRMPHTATGMLASGTNDVRTYNLDCFAGGEFVVWTTGANYEAELALFGSGVPVISSVRGQLIAGTGNQAANQSLEKLRALLQERTKGRWEIRPRTNPSIGPVIVFYPETNGWQGCVNIFPFPQDDEGRKKVAYYMSTCQAPLYILGHNADFTVLAATPRTNALCVAVSALLGLSLPDAEAEADARMNRGAHPEPKAAAPAKRKPRQRQASVGDAVVSATSLEIMETRIFFSRISSHFANTPIADKPGFMYAGVDTAGIPVTEEPRTIFLVSASKVPGTVSFQPGKATLKTRAGQIVTCITNETIHMSCPGYVFPLWREERGHVTGFVVFPLAEEPDGEFRLPYVDQGKAGELVFRFGEGD